MLYKKTCRTNPRTSLFVFVVLGLGVKCIRPSCGADKRDSCFLWQRDAPSSLVKSSNVGIIE